MGMVSLIGLFFLVLTEIHIKNNSQKREEFLSKFI